jgi:hypothetical protein
VAPVISAERNRLKRVVNSGPATGSIFTSAESGTIVPFAARA